MKTFKEEEAVFAAALHLSPEDRRAYLQQVCGSDVPLRRRIEALLKSYAAAEEVLENPASPDLEKAISAPNSFNEQTGGNIGRYKLLQQIGEGGCGVVYMAEQEEPVRRRVALKIIKLGMDTKQVIARFEAERQALALMDHPNIAKVLDAGATETGRPYFVMELVRGVKITEYCDHNNLPIKNRLELFVQVCRAIQHAHQKGIIHRDIKPSNILVTLHDGVGVPKVIDFGIAKATQGRLTDLTLFTAFEQFMGTPAYTSPEQAEISGLDIDTRSDVYSLGVLLYELLTGKTPFDTQKLLAAGLDEMRRTIREQEPARPSTKLSTMLEGELTATARRLHTEAPKLLTAVRGDLDWIVMKCLEKDRARRYETASGLARDIERHLAHEPVIACPPSRSYRFNRLVRRNRWAVMGGVAIAASLVIGLGLAGWMLFQERKERQRANLAEKKAQGEAGKSEREAHRARLAEAAAKDKLWDSYLAQAQAKRFSGRAGRRYEALETLKKAAAIRPGLELRNEAIACLALTDLKVGKVWDSENGAKAAYDSAYERFVLWQTNGSLAIRRIADNSEVMRLAGEFPQIGWLLKFSPDGRWLALTRVTNGAELEIWDLVQNRAAKCFPGRDCRTIQFSPDSRLAAISFHHGSDTNNPIVIYNIAGDSIEAAFDHGTLPDTLLFHPTKPELATSSQASDEVQIWDLQSRRILQRLKHPRELSQIAWNPTGDLLASCCADCQVYVWDVSKGRPSHVLSGHSGFPREVSFSYDGRFLASRGWDGNLIFWDPWTGERLFKQLVSGFTDGFSSANYRYGYFPGGERLGFLELDVSQTCRLLRPGLMLRTYGQDCDFSPDGKLLLTAHEDGLRIWDPTRGNRLAFAEEPQTRFAIFEPAADTLLLASDSGIWECILRRDSGDRITGLTRRRQISAAAADELQLSESGSMLEFSVAGTMHFVDLTTGAERLIPGFDDWRLNTGLSPDGKLVACGSACDRITRGGACPVRVFNVENGALVQELPHHEDARPVFSLNGKWLLTGDNRDYRLWDVASWKPIYSIPRGNVGYTAFMAFSPDCSVAALSVTRDTVRLIETASGRELATLEAPEAHDIYCLRFSKDGSRLGVLYRYGPIHVWDLALMRQQLAQMNLNWESPSSPVAIGKDAAEIATANVLTNRLNR